MAETRIRSWGSMGADQELEGRSEAGDPSGTGGVDHEFGVLGETIARAAGRRVELGPARQRGVLAALLVDAGSPVSLDQLGNRVWGDTPPLRAAGALRSHLSRLRGALAATGYGGIRRRPGGYVIEVDETAVDLHRFRRLAKRARTGCVGAGDLFEQALGLWRGEALADLDSPWAAGVRHALEVERFSVRLDFFDARLREGRHSGLLADLASLVAAHPLDERVAGQYITVLYRSGRQAEALTVYDRIRRQLADELGADPCPQLQQLYQRILTGDLAVLADQSAATLEPVRERAIPRQLPASVPGFVGRARELQRLDDLLVHADPARRPGPTAVVISAIDGTAGIGKTALAIHWAQRTAHRFPDGQLYLNLRGYGPDQPVDPSDALESMLRALDVPSERIPGGLDERSALLRSRLSECRMLILLDNARDSDQVRPLLPGSGGLVLVTSRRRLRALSARDGARHVNLDLLPMHDALQLLADAVGGDRIEREPQHAEEIVTLCARLPLALRLAAERINRFPAATLSDLAGELRGHHSRLGALSIDESPDTDLRSVFSWSYSALDPDSARMFDLLGLHPGAASSVSAAAALAGIPPAQAQRLLDRLTNVSLLEQRFPGRYEFHDLLRDFALEHDPPDISAAYTRLVHWYVHTAANARAQLTGIPHRMPVDVAPPEGVEPVQFASLRDAVAWFDLERDALVKIVRAAGGYGIHEGAAVLYGIIWVYLYMRGHVRLMITAGDSAVECATAIGNYFLEAKCRNGLGVGMFEGRMFEKAIASFHHAFAIFSELGDVREQATVLLNMGNAYNNLQRFSDSREKLKRAHSMFLQVGETLSAALALNNLADSYLGSRQFEKALDCAHQALRAIRTGHEKFRQVRVLETIANIHAARGDHPSAISSYREALDVAAKTQATEREVLLRIELGKQLSTVGKHDEAIIVWREAHQICITADNPAAAEIEELLGEGG
jgi:DNA-binding SARP family transcriptional activator/tetratricopeptide (TPR) repeat protein